MTRAQPFGANRIDIQRAWVPIPAPQANPHRITDRLVGAMTAIRAFVRISRPRSERPYYPPRRESFIEDAAMAREMLRL